MSASSHSFPWRRWVWLGLILLAEYLLVSFLFDVGPLRRADRWYRGLGYLGILAPMFLTMVTAIALLQGGRLRRTIPALGSELSAPPTWWLLVPHGVLYVLFLFITTQVFAGERVESDLLLLVWLVCGVAFPVLLIRVALPLRVLVALVRTIAPALVGSAGIGVLAWSAGLASEQLWDPLGRVTLRAAVIMLSGITDDVVFDASEALVGTSLFSVRVAPICSGYEGIGLILVFLGAYLWVFRKTVRWPRAWLLFPLAVLAVWLANDLRIVGLIAVGSWISPEIALGGFHSKAGWLLFCVVAFGFVVLARRSRWFSVTESDDSEAYDNPVVPYLAPLVIVLLTMLVTGMFSSGLDLFYPVRVVAGAAAIVLLAPRRHLLGAPSLVSVVIGIAVFALWVGTATELQRPLSAELAAMPTVAMVAWLVARAIGTILVIPVVEELAFRGYLMRRLIGRDFAEVAMTRFAWWAVLGSSLAFGLLHQRAVVGTVAGILFALAMLHRGRLRDAVYAHAITNGLLVVYAVGTGRWGLWF